jgi:hypothetical protein
MDKYTTLALRRGRTIINDVRALNKYPLGVRRVQKPTLKPSGGV